MRTVGGEMPTKNCPTVGQVVLGPRIRFEQIARTKKTPRPRSRNLGFFNTRATSVFVGRRGNGSPPNTCAYGKTMIGTSRLPKLPGAFPPCELVNVFSLKIGPLGIHMTCIFTQVHLNRLLGWFFFFRRTHRHSSSLRPR